MYFGSNILGHSNSHKWCGAVMQNQRKLAKDCLCTLMLVVHAFIIEISQHVNETIIKLI